MSTTPSTVRRLAATVLAASFLVTACGGTDADVAAPPAEDTTTSPADDGTGAPSQDDTAPDGDTDLPAAVAEMQRFLTDAAQRRDEQLLRTAVEEGATNYTFGGSEDPIAYWRAVEEQGGRPYEALVAMLATTPALADGEVAYVWPRVTTGRPEDTTDAAWAELEAFYTAEEIETFRASEVGYLGWRVGIRPDGSWAFFVQGD